MSNHDSHSKRPLYDCTTCPAYCCSYDRIIIEDEDLSRLAKRFSLSEEAARRKFTHVVDEEQVLRHQRDDIFGSVCMFLDRKTRQCTVYDARPEVCKEYPDRPHCGYFDFLKWERQHQDDPEFVPMKRYDSPRRGR